MTTIDKITDIIAIVIIIAIVLAIICVIGIIIILVNNLKDSIKPSKYYRIEYIYDHNGKFQSTIKARTPKQAIRKLLRKHPRYYPLNDITDIISCKEVDYYKCLKEVEEDE